LIDWLIDTDTDRQKGKSRIASNARSAVPNFRRP